ncbi:YhdP family protein [Colwellia sp. E2M01]|uniref:YhdP family protein n=1 Tax=Colwellia sp. E2M01 TaxID=2841561 RepID=UPI001C0A0178|nr:YhdP family protein [Colwellia sp. E2M01]MBU2870292.1 TIGR02099 family protein [Colwellia sp. E2M01]
MNIVGTSNRWLNYLYKTVAILLVLLAVAISAFRLLLPFVHHYQLPLQNYLNEQANSNIVIGDLSMTWQDFGPSLVLGNVQIIETDNTSVFIKQLELQVDFWQSISQQDLISKNLFISGADIDVNEQLWLAADADEIANDNSDEMNDIDFISDVFLNKIKRFSILNSHVTVRNETITRSIRLNTLRWVNNGSRHQAQGSVVLNELSSNNLTLKLDLRGKKITGLTGDAYLQANHIDITPWLDNVLVLEDDKTKSDINFSAWLEVKKSQIKRLKVNFSDSYMAWSYHGDKQRLTLEKGQVLLVKDKHERSFNLYSTPLTLQLNEQAAQNFTVMLAKNTNDFSLHLSDVDLSMIAELTPLIVANEGTRKLLSDMSLNGKVEDIYIRNDKSGVQAVANFSALNSRYSHGIPGLKNATGQLSFVDNYLAIDFSAEQGSLDFDELFVQAFPYDKLTGEFNVAFDNSGWILNVEQLDFLSKEINLSAQVNVEAPTNDEVNLALLVNVSNGNAGLVGRYLPLPIMSDNLVEYLNSAVVSGRVENAQVLINGPISRFPFTDGSGIFVVDAELSDAEFKFVENWPSINDFVANLNFTNNSMLITGRDGLLAGLDVTGVTAGIADLSGEAVLLVDADIKSTDSSNISRLMNQSPLQNSVGSALDYINIQGKVSGDFSLNLPLDDSELGVATGSINFDNNKVALQAPQLNFSDVQGQLNFANDVIDTKNMQLIWQGLPVTLDITGNDRDSYYHTAIKLQALWQESQWLPYVPDSLRSYTQGELPWQGELSLHQHHDGGFSYDAKFSSELTNTQLLLPMPYAQNSTQKNTLNVNIHGEDKESKIVLNYGDEMHFSGLLNHENVTFTRANLMLGKGNMVLPNDGFHITTKLDYVDFAQWQILISDILDSHEPKTIDNEQANTQPLLAKPTRIRGTVGQLNILGQALNHVTFNLLEKPEWQLLLLDSTETRSQIKIYPDWLAQGVDINAEFLKLPQHEKVVENEQNINPNLNVDTTTSPLLSIELMGPQPLESSLIDKEENDSIFANMPPIKFHCDSCSIGSLNLGVVDFTVKRANEDTIEFNNFTASRNKTKLNLNGRWRHNKDESTTTLTGRLDVDDVESELKAMGYASIIKDSGATVDLDLNWPGGLHDFSVNHLDGTVHGRLDDGYLAEVSDKARLFSVLSLQSLVRKLTLDFRDIFSDGMFYSNIQGHYQLEQGLLKTNDTEMNGTAGNLFMTGHTNLVTGELDYDMSYKPNLTSSLPVLAWIATLNPVTFLAGVAIDQVIKSQVVSEFNFKLTGSIEDPDFKEVDRKSKSISVDTALPIADSQQTNLPNPLSKELLMISTPENNKPALETSAETTPENITSGENDIE